MPTVVTEGPPLARVLLYWLPLGAGGHSVRWNGRLFEAFVAHRERRPANDLYHSPLEVHIGDDRFVVEMTPTRGTKVADRGVVCEGPVGSRWLWHLEAFRYEIRCWHMGTIPHLTHCVASPQQIGQDLTRAQRLLNLVPQVPTLTWGRDELQTGDMWNSNSVIAWLLARSGHDPCAVHIPANGRAPGWHAGLIVASRDHRSRPPTPAVEVR
jgi:hypothetical protein